MIRDIKNTMVSIWILNKKILKNKNTNNRMNNKIILKISINNNKNKRNKSRNLKEEVSLKVTKIFMTHENIYFNCIYIILTNKFIL
jgi:hypothetical protein